ncbi:hypothetical protein V6N11_024547 [Hibiscus sabdariffa]|uniref:Uncharacterized protein n=1 Tax=Hibiscus sabdariffa TaxID=183260 RepID=A0ABR2QMJ7_9ROSI
MLSVLEFLNPPLFRAMVMYILLVHSFVPLDKQEKQMHVRMRISKVPTWLHPYYYALMIVKLSFQNLVVRGEKETATRFGLLLGLSCVFAVFIAYKLSALTMVFHVEEYLLSFPDSKAWFSVGADKYNAVGHPGIFSFPPVRPFYVGFPLQG